MGKHVIVGAGQVGALVAERLAEQGHEVVLVSRSGSGPDGVEKVAADASDAARLTELAKGADVLYNCVNPAYHRWVEDWPPIAGALLKTAEATGAGYIMLGNLYAYGPPSGPMRETDPLAPSSAKAGVRAKMWRDALEAHEAGRIRVAELRSSDYFGPGCRGQSPLGERFVPPLLSGKTARFIGDPAQPHSWTYVLDVARAVVTAATDNRSWGRAWHVPTAPAMAAREVAERLCHFADVPNPGVKPLPNWLLRAIGMANPLVREMQHVRYQFANPFIVDSSDFETTFGVAPTPMDEALQETVTWWKDQ